MTFEHNTGHSSEGFSRHVDFSCTVDDVRTKRRRKKECLMVSCRTKRGRPGLNFTSVAFYSNLDLTANLCCHLLFVSQTQIWTVSAQSGWKQDDNLISKPFLILLTFFIWPLQTKLKPLSKKLNLEKVRPKQAPGKHWDVWEVFSSNHVKQELLSHIWSDDFLSSCHTEAFHLVP